MQWESCLSRNILIERAKEELEILEFYHPNKFESMKIELKAFISELESQDLVSKSSSSMLPCPSAATQESSSIRKTKRRGGVVEEVEASNAKDGSCVKRKRRCRTDAVLERAQLCLHKIQHLKTTFF
ncbi:hypothetical protein ACS0TY_008731 [Phlomoides rotata]